MTKAELHRLVDALPDDVLEGTADLLQRVVRREIDPDQAWFWARAWQAGEREADADLAAGRVSRFDGDDIFLEHLERVPPPGDPAADPNR
jgi:hypothetical protein